MIPAIVATLAPIVNSIQIFPQLYKTYQTKSVKDLSLYFLKNSSIFSIRLYKLLSSISNIST